MKTHISMIASLLLLLCGAAFANPPVEKEKSLSVRTFQFKYKDADKAAAVIKPLMSADGSMSMQGASKAVVVTDHPENVKAIANALAQFDTPAQTFRLSIRLVAAGREKPASRVPDDLKDIAPNLEMLRFTSFEKLGEAEFEGKEGDAGMLEMQTGYRADFHFGEYDLTSDSIKVSDLRVSRLTGAQRDQLTSLLKTTLNLKLGQTVILGAARAPQSQRSLMIVVSAHR
jgi:hypothetical protein